MSFLGSVGNIFSSITSSLFNNAANSTLEVIRSNATVVYNAVVNYVIPFFSSNTHAVTESSTLHDTLTTTNSYTTYVANSTVDNVLISTNNSAIDSSHGLNVFIYCMVAIGFVCVMRHICYHFMRGFREERSRDLMLRRFFSEIEGQNNGINCKNASKAVCRNVVRDIVRQQTNIDIGEGGNFPVSNISEELRSGVVPNVCGSSCSIDCEEMSLSTISKNVVVEEKVTEKSAFL
ncbi:hypothetical protein DRF75_02215 [Ehrlichia minasensis]|uniref:Uncharacterized protein n=1 Tax=Ehrlichia minasensis TaxID=1242993 RepID=A0A4Q6I4K5_9RICK|nr:hypothetical protein [Ehrlichia minasensis]RZB12815.1 hypothetical protein DRF75_02215 [Ehrlichia minasensis]